MIELSFIAEIDLSSIVALLSKGYYLLDIYYSMSIFPRKNIQASIEFEISANPPTKFQKYC